MKKNFVFKRIVKCTWLCLTFTFTMSFTGCAGKVAAQPLSENSSPGNPADDSGEPIVPGEAGGSVVYFTGDISPAGLMSVYRALSVTPTGKVGVKVTTGEPPNSNYLRQDLIGAFTRSVNGTYVECNTAYGGPRASAAMHKQVARDHGFAPFDLLDEEGTVQLPTPSGSKNLSYDIVGSHISNYDFMVVLSHFKGHAMSGMGGAIKNLSIGFGSSEGKVWIHTAGHSKNGSIFWNDQNAFQESLAEAAGAVMDYFGENIIYINVMNRLSVDCDCNGNPAEPDMHDIGILASLDPVALDKASVDLVSAAPDGTNLLRRIEQRSAVHALVHAAAIGIGSLDYDLVKLN